ncbi:hypothetical protein PG987_010381 [Apiospora arundinis]
MGPVHRLLPLVFGAIAAQKYGATSSSFLVSNFIAGATPHSADGYADLSLWYAEDSVSANCHASPLTYQIFPSVPWTVCSDYRTAYNLTVTGDGGAELRLSYQPTGGTSIINGTHTIPPDQIVWINQDDPIGKVQVYVGPGSFPVST